MSEWQSPRKIAELEAAAQEELRAAARQSRVEMVDEYADLTSKLDEDGWQVPNAHRAGAIALMAELDHVAGDGLVVYPSVETFAPLLGTQPQEVAVEQQEPVTA